MENLPQNQPKELFPDVPAIHKCTTMFCRNGHELKPTMVVFDCPGCKSPSLIVKMENCPFCNEPIERMELRVDWVPKGGGVAKRCIGETVRGETMDISLERVKLLEVEKDEEASKQV